MDFVQRESAAITKFMTIQHRKMTQAFIDCKERFEVIMNEREHILQGLMMSEILIAQKAPTMEVEFALDDRSPLSLYDCLLPMLKH